MLALGLGRVPALRGGAAAGLGLTAGYVAGHLGTTGWKGLTPTDVTNWLPHVAVAGGLLSLVTVGRRAEHLDWRRLAPIALSPFVAWLLLRPYADRLETGVFVGVLLAATVGMAVIAAGWSGALHRQGPVVSGAALAVAACGMAAGAAGSGSVVVAQLTGSVAAAATAASLGIWVARVEVRLEALGAVAGLVLGGLAIVAVAYSSTPWYAAALFALVPVGLWGVRALTRDRLGRAAAIAAQLTVVVALTGAAAAWAAMPSTTSGHEGGAYDYGYGEGSDSQSPYDYGYE